jgi:SAM-dependent methyltransferase
MPLAQGAGTVNRMAHSHAHDHAHSHQGGHSHFGELLDLDAEVLHEYHREMITWVGSLTRDRARIVDLGAGTGTGALALARQLPNAEVIAVDVDDEMLERLRHKAHALGLADRVRTVAADLDSPWPDLGLADLVWASNSMHHMADPGRALSQTLATLRPGGLLAMAELDSFPRFLTDAAGAALEDRCHNAMAAVRVEAGMHMDEDWSARLAEAGFTVEADRRFDIALSPPLPPAAGRYARLSFERARDRLDDRLSADDLAALDALVSNVEHRDDLTVRATRTVWTARRP